MVVVLPRRDQISGRNRARAYNRKIREVADGIGVPMIDTLDDLQALFRAAGADQVNIPWDGHHTKHANEAIAKAMIPTLLRIVPPNRQLRKKK
jgi:hypothetical protein